MKIGYTSTKNKMAQPLQPVFTHQQLCTAIKTKRLIEFTYHNLRRVAEPHDFGILNGAEHLLVYQVAGQSRSMKLSDWRLIRIAEIKQLKVLDKQFSGGRSVPSGKHKKWDKLFIRVALSA
jgi:hypothetical protein